MLTSATRKTYTEFLPNVEPYASLLCMMDLFTSYNVCLPKTFTLSITVMEIKEIYALIATRKFHSIVLLRM